METIGHLSFWRFKLLAILAFDRNRSAAAQVLFCFMHHVCRKLLLCSKETPQPDVFESADRDLTVDNALTATHMLRLNKFNVVPYHSLTITRQFEPQQAPLTLADWKATFSVMQVGFI